MLQPNSVKEVAEKLVLLQAMVADSNSDLELVVAKVLVATIVQAAEIAYARH